MTSVAVVPAEVQVASLTDYLKAVSSVGALQQQQQLAAAYDAACAALVGPNDVQQEGGRTFKKKSAWRKLARHFNISVAASLDSVRVEHHEQLGFFTAYAIATASAPWGQSWTDVGACGSDEATGRRTITIADAIATAMTRASNRAVSNLIAMGEVSAEEIGDREPMGDRSRPAAAPSAKPSAKPRSTQLDHPGTPNDPACPTCGGRMWDNRAEKRNPKAPDFKCRSRSCDGVIWPARPGEQGEEPPHPALKDDPDDLPF